ncbi:MAG: hypothetical protein SVR08_07520 [Spirochaetota bacterium]|nr:hypothetical protein [Spirochaetota bacterium]
MNLDIKLDRFISNVKLNKIEELISTKHNYDARISFIPYSVRFQISYNDIPEKLVKNKISISDKSVLIELREKTEPNDQIYFTVSPTGTETHLELLNTIEKMLA